MSPIDVLQKFKSYVESSGVEFDNLTNPEKREWRESFDKLSRANQIGYRLYISIESCLN